jgi:hypothetical protein
MIPPTLKYLKRDHPLRFSDRNFVCTFQFPNCVLVYTDDNLLGENTNIIKTNTDPIIDDSTPGLRGGPAGQVPGAQNKGGAKT